MTDYTKEVWGVTQTLLKAGYSEEVILEVFKQGATKPLSFYVDYANELADMAKPKKSDTIHTGKFYIECGIGEDAYQEPWELITQKSDTNLCDQEADGDCDKEGIYYTDADWSQTYYCGKHFAGQVADGIFKLIPEVWEVGGIAKDKSEQILGHFKSDNEAQIRHAFGIPPEVKLVVRKVGK